MATRTRLGLQRTSFVCLLLLMVLLTGVASQSDFEITFSSHPMSQVVVIGQQVSLSCMIQSSLLPMTFRWYHDNNEVTFVQSKYAISNAAPMTTLHINFQTSSDEGQYWCVAEFADLGMVRSLSATLTLADIASIQGATSGTMNVRVFDQVVLRCPPPASTPPSAISWLRDSSLVTPTAEGRVAITLDGDLIISGVQAEETGRYYQCQATNPVSMTTVRSGTSVLLGYNPEQRNSYEAQQFEVQPEGIQRVLIGGSARFQCFTTGGPVSSITWYKDGSLLSPGNQPRVTLEQGSRLLSVSNVGEEDAGMYWCQAEQLGFDDTAVNSTTEELLVLVPPSITAGPGNQTALAEASKTLSCEASGSAPLQWNWLHDGEPIESDGHFVVISNQLQINDIDQSSDSGVYQCVAQHSLAGGAMSAGVLNVQVSGPVITNVTDTDVVTFVGDTVELRCTAAGSPVPSYRWFKDQAVVTGARFSLNGGDLTLTSSVTSDSGPYVCEAFSTAGTARSPAVLVEIIDPLIVERAPPISKQVELGSSPTLPCKLRKESTQSVTYEWAMNDAVVDTTSVGSRFVLTDGSGNLTITNAVRTDSGLYTCYGLIILPGKMADSVRQKVGESTVVVATTPGQPASVTVSNIDTRSLHLSWNSPLEDGGRDIVGYIIEVRVISPFGNIEMTGFNSTWQQWNQSDLPTPMTSYEVTGLYPYTSYQFRVMAENSIGQGQPSEPSETHTTNEDVPDAPPQSVDATKSGEVGSVNISWQPPPIRGRDGRGRNGVITSYTVSYGLNGVRTTNEEEVRSNVSSLLIRKLNLNSFYTLRVRAHTSAGAGSYSDGVTVSTVAFDPEELTNILAELISNVSSSRGGVVNVTWDPPTIPEEFSSAVRVLSYVVTFLLSETSDDVLQEFTVPADVTWVVVPELDWGRRYAFIIQVNYSSFSNLGPPALGRVGSLPPGPPSPILTVTPTVGLDSTLVLVWELPSDGGSPIVRLVVEAYSQDTGWSSVANLSSTVTTHSIPNVFATGFSHFRVVACNSLGCSWGRDQSGVALPDPTTAEPFYKTIWFIVVVAVVGLILVVLPFIFITVLCTKCCVRLKKGTYTSGCVSSERESSVGSMISVRHRPMYTLSYGQNQSNSGRNSPFVNNLSQSGHVLSDSITGLDTHLEFGPPGEPTYGGSIMSQSTVQSRSTFQTQSSHKSSHNNLLQAKYSGVQHHWLNQGFSQDTPEDQRRRDFIRGLTDIGDTDSMGAESVASTYV